MHNKKIKSSVAALALGAIIIGGTFAWFSAKDSVTNTFKTVAMTQGDVGIEVWEIFDETGAGKTVANTAVNKDVQVKNVSQYNAIIKVQLIPKFGQFIKGENGKEEFKEYTDRTLDATKIKLNLKTDNVVKLDAMETGKDYSGKWIEVPASEAGGYPTYYYIGNVAPQGFTAQLLDSVTLDNSVATNPAYKGVSFMVDVNAVSTEAVKGAVKEGNGGFAIANNTLASALEKAIDDGAETGAVIQITEGGTTTTATKHGK